jgi:hypothetical protein
MKVNLNTTIELETRLLLDEYCKKSGESIAQTVDNSLVYFLQSKAKE